MSFFNFFKRKSLGTGEGQVFKDGIKALAFEIYRGISILHVVQLEENGSLTYKYLFYTSVLDGERRQDTLYHGTASDLEQSKAKAMAEIDKLS